ncbi:MAG: hypothetical protein ACRDRP_08625 [Pseudonocardiaceae bacterium]
MPAGARVFFSDGAAVVGDWAAAPPGHAAAAISIISPGTELRNLAASRDRPHSPAGYMCLTQPVTLPGRRTAVRVLAPVPHGAPAPAGHPRALTVPAGIDVALAAVARFQLIAALGLAQLSAGPAGREPPVVAGAGPVGLAAVLELRRRGAGHVLVVTGHPDPAAGMLPGVTVRSPARGLPARLLIDTTGRVVRAAGMVADGGTLGLLGTPADTGQINAGWVHRAGVTLVGMHELAGFDRDHYQRTYDQVLAWLDHTIDPALVRSWCRSWPGTQAASVYAALAEPGRRPREPILLLDWERR